MQRYTALKCTGSVNITVERTEEGLKLCGTEPFECITKDNKIVARNKAIIINSSFSNGFVNISNCSNISNSFNVSNGATFFQSSRAQRFYVDGVDVTDDVKQAVNKKKATIVQEDKEDERYKREHILIGIILLSDVSISDNSKVQIKHANLLDSEILELSASDSAILDIPSYNTRILTVKTDDSSKIRGDISSQRLLIRASDASSASNFHVQDSCKLKASDCSEISISASREANIEQKKTEFGKIKVVYYA